MPVRIEAITMDCRDERILSAFWTGVLGYQVAVDQPGDWMVLQDPSGTGPRIGLQVVPEPKVVKNRVHLDLDVGGGRTAPLAERRRRVDAEADRLVAAGATRFQVLSEEGVDHYGVVMQDPEGNEFCLH
jgi:hypothetical protein